MGHGVTSTPPPRTFIMRGRMGLRDGQGWKTSNLGHPPRLVRPLQAITAIFAYADGVSLRIPVQILKSTKNGILNILNF